MSEYFWYLVVCICIVGIIASFNSMLSNSGDDDDSFSIMGYRPVIVVTPSMTPNIQVNSISLVKYCGIEDIEIGDIVMYKADNGMRITHRCVGNGTLGDGNYYITTKGDANWYADRLPITSDMVMGKLVYTCNAVAPFISSFMIAPGEINSISLLRSMIMLGVLLVVIGSIICWLFRILILFIGIVLNKGKYTEYIEEYKDTLERMEEARRTVFELENSSGHGLKGIRLSIAKYLAIKEMKGCSEMAKDFESSIKRIRWITGIIGDNSGTSGNTNKYCEEPDNK